MRNGNNTDPFPQPDFRKRLRVMDAQLDTKPVLVLFEDLGCVDAHFVSAFAVLAEDWSMIIPRFEVKVARDQTTELRFSADTDALRQHGVAFDVETLRTLVSHK